MSTDLERLHAWMQDNGHDELSLRNALGYATSIKNILNGKRPVPELFKWNFGSLMGNDALRAVFGIDFGDSRAVYERGFSEGLWHPEKSMARGAVFAAVESGRLPRANTLKCHGCDKQARDYHHESYAPKDRLCIVPLCRPCHQLHHSGKKVLTFGVVPTHTELIRIATRRAA